MLLLALSNMRLIIASPVLWALFEDAAQDEVALQITLPPSVV